MDKKYSLGFTLIELILYVALIAIFVTGAVYFAWDVAYGREKASQQLIVDQTARIAMARISYEVSKASSFSIVGGDLQLESVDGTTVFSLSADNLQITQSGSTYNLTTNQARVTSFSLTDLSDTDNSSANVMVEITVEQKQTAPTGQNKAQTTLRESMQLNSQFNQARKMLVDLTFSDIAFANTQVVGITIEDSSADDITVDKMMLSWTGTLGGEKVVEVQIGGGLIEWTGAAASSEEIDIDDFILTAADGVVDVDYIEFDTDMAGAIIQIEFIMSDGSSSISQLEIVTPT